MTTPSKIETIALKHPRKLELEGKRTMRSHIWFRYADDTVTINLQLWPQEARELAAKLTAVADFCGED